MVKFKVVRTYDRKRHNYPTWEVVHVKTKRTVFSVLGDDRADLAITMADQFEANPKSADLALKLNTKENKYA